MKSLNDILSIRHDALFGTDDPILPDPIQTNAPQHQTDQNPPANADTPPDNDVNLSQLKSMLYSIKNQLDSVLRVIEGKEVKDWHFTNSDIKQLETGERIIEGVFNGEKMIGSDNKEYSVPPNYASKSKLVEGDNMKLTITNKGSFIYKQISQIERKRVVGELVADYESGQWSVLANGKTYKVLTASVTFFKGRAGDEAVILIPQNSASAWGAVENIISK